MNLLEKILGIGRAVAETTGQSTGTGTTDPSNVEAVSPIASILVTVLPMVLLFAVFYFMLIRPQKKKDKQVQEMLNNLTVGDRVCTIGGIYGTITQVKDDQFVLTVGNQNMTMNVARWAIRSKEDVSIENDAEALN